MIIKLKKTEMNALLKELNYSKPEYGLIYSLIYIYARQAKEVLCLQKKHVNVKKDIITFNVNNNSVSFPLIASIKKDLQSVVDSKKRDEYLFLDTPEDLDKLTTNLYNYLNRRLIKLNRHYGWECNKLTLTELRKLRAQHLIKDGVRLETVMDLFLNRNISEFKEFIDYDALVSKFPYSNVDTIFKEHTNLNIFTIDGYKYDDVFTVVDGEGNECTLIVSMDNVDVVEFNDVAAMVYDIDEYYLIDQLSLLDYGEYVVIGDLKFLKY